MNLINGGVCAAKGFKASGIHAGIRKNKTKKDRPMEGGLFYYYIYFTMERIRVIRVFAGLTVFFSAIRAEKPSQ